MSDYLYNSSPRVYADRSDKLEENNWPLGLLLNRRFNWLNFLVFKDHVGSVNMPTAAKVG